MRDEDTVAAFRADAGAGAQVVATMQALAVGEAMCAPEPAAAGDEDFPGGVGGEEDDEDGDRDGVEAVSRTGGR
jgi:hypothetical protein